MFTIPNATGRAPVIETARFRLRGHRPADFADCLALWNEAAVYRHITGKPGTEAEVWARILRYIGHWNALGFGYWAVEDKATGQFIGEVGFADYKREIEPPLTGMPELGWVLAPARHGKGYGSEAVGAAVAWGDAHFGSRRMCCISAPENTASLRLAAKFGFKEVAHTTYLGDPTIMFVREARHAQVRA
jgi:RimJ/RimL family protein N-acetyltransferase